MTPMANPPRTGRRFLPLLVSSYFSPSTSYSLSTSKPLSGGMNAYNWKTRNNGDLVKYWLFSFYFYLCGTSPRPCLNGGQSGGGGEIAAELKGAIESKEIDAVFRAVERGADLKKALDIEEKHSSIAWMLQLAVMKRYQRIIEIVVHCPTADIILVNETGSTALMVACDRSWGEMDDDRIPQILLDQPAVNVNAADRQGKTALMKACWRGNELVVQHLLEHRLTDVNLQDDNGESALTMSASLGFIAIVRRLLRRPDIDVNKANNLGRTALMEASAQGHDSVVGELLGYQPTDVNLQDNGGDTPLVLASRAGAVPVVVSLLRHSHIDINKVNLQGSTALMEASHKGHWPVVQELLLQPSIQIELRDDHGSTCSDTRIWGCSPFCCYGSAATPQYRHQHL
ncbi:ankyrin repeat-containing domain protein [Coprinopsis sp. MPI-PUGE-AT-0042]|nr:ankyrin repeat-containing domain protein [Coprinopsis sp. MPI-PUGE-AT-0042]